MTATPAEVAAAAFAAVAAHDPDGIVACGAPDYIDDFVAVGEFKGHDAIRAFFAEMFAAVPDLAMTVDRIVADDSSAVVQWHAGGTFTGSAFQGIEATGKRINLRGVDVMEIENGLIAHNTIYYDGASFARQVGLLPPQGSRVDRMMLGAFNAKTRAVRRRKQPA